MTRSLTMYQADAFAAELFKGNPAAVVPLDAWLDDELMKSIAVENNLSETAFFVPEGDGFRLRWFTPTRKEMKLCGHATLATAYILMTQIEPDRTEVHFESLSGPLMVRRDGELFTLDFPVAKLTPAPHHPKLERAIGVRVMEYWKASNTMRMAVLGNEADVLAVAPRMPELGELGGDGLIVTAPGDAEGIDFVSRFFAPNVGIREDPVTGSAHTVLTPYWAKRLKMETFRARQLSARGGELACELKGDRVHIGGRGALFFKGEIYV